MRTARGRCLTSYSTLRETAYVSGVAIAAVYVGLGEDDRAFEWLDKAAGQPGALHFWIPTDPLWNRMRAHPRFQKILDRWKRPGR